MHLTEKNMLCMMVPNSPCDNSTRYNVVLLWHGQSLKSVHKHLTWWHHHMKTFSALLTLCEGNPPVTGGFPHKSQWRGALMSFYLRLNKWLSKESRRQWFEAPSCSLWRHCNEYFKPELSSCQVKTSYITKLNKVDEQDRCYSCIYVSN